MNSCLYETTIMHHRFSPKVHRFAYRFFSFYLDLDEIDELGRTIKLLGHNKFNAYSFYDKDHLLQESNDSLKQSVMGFVKTKGIDLTGGRIMLLTYLRTFGHLFNPVSFYFCFDKEGRPQCVVPEIGNTFGELKHFFIGNGKSGFESTQDKFYYISPFMKLDDCLDFKLRIPDEHLNIAIDTSRMNEKMLVTTMTGKRRELNNANLLKLTLKFPLVTLKVITLIHWHALLLWLKKIPYEEKANNLHLQKEAVRVFPN